MLKEVEWSPYHGGGLVWGYLKGSKNNFCYIDCADDSYGVVMLGSFTGFGINGKSYDTLEEAKEGVIKFMGNVLMKFAMTFLDQNALTVELRKNKIAEL